MKKLIAFIFTILMATSPIYAVSNAELCDILYPVGSYYETADESFIPQNVWGGTWVLEDPGLVHIGAYSNVTGSQNGGLATNIIPNHTHGIPSTSSLTVGASGTHSHIISYRDALKSGSVVDYPVGYGSTTYTGTRTSSSAGGHTHTFTFGAGTMNSFTQTGTPTNYQPYVCVNRWHRVG